MAKIYNHPEGFVGRYLVVLKDHIKNDDIQSAYQEIDDVVYEYKGWSKLLPEAKMIIIGRASTKLIEELKKKKYVDLIEQDLKVSTDWLK